MSAEERAMGVLALHPDWTDEQIAERAGCSRTTLYRLPAFVAARERLRSDADLPRGSKSKAGDVEAVDE